jgi:hypothetical protein
MKFPYLGVIEGFFGRAWSFSDRYEYADFLCNQGYHFYIYAPKNDPYLRKKWQEKWPTEVFIQLQSLINRYQSLGLDFGIGLSPFEIYKKYDRSARICLKAKIALLNRLGINILCVLFDDMQGDFPDLGQRQAEIISDVLDQSKADRVIICPTYYSSDPVLDNVFGQRPKGYFQELVNGLPAAVDIFWTGPQVCSQQYSEPHLQEVAQLLGRKPFLWDNYPVNDGRITSQFIHLKPFENRPGFLAQLTQGHAVNPMNQPWLSRIPLYSLPRSYSEGRDYDPQKIGQEAVTQIGDKKLASQLLNDLEMLHTQGLKSIDPLKKEELRQQYACFSSPYAQEIIDWLNEKYAFDPACLTD